MPSPSYTFDSDLESWTERDFTSGGGVTLIHQSGDGDPDNGCAELDFPDSGDCDGDESNGGIQSPDFGTTSFTSGEQLTFRIKIINNDSTEHTYTLDVSLQFGCPSCNEKWRDQTQTITVPGSSNSGWITKTYSPGGFSEYDTIRIDIRDEVDCFGLYTARFDTISVGASGNARFYHAPAGQSLAEKFTLPFAGVEPGAMTLDAALGTVVIGSNAPAGQVAVYSQHPYTTGTATDTGLPTGTAITNLKWI